jgi:hypothetical protein
VSTRRNCEGRRRAYHVRVIRVQSHVREWVEAGEGAEGAVRVELRERVRGALAGLHGGERLRGGAGGGASWGGALDHVHCVAGLDLIRL